MNYQKILFFLIFFEFLFGCNSGREKINESIILHEGNDSASVALPEIRFYHYEEKNDFPDAIIEMFTPLSNQTFRPGKVPFEFNIKNYPYAEGIGGFQLNMILNSSDPIGYNMPIFQRELNEGTYRCVAYLVDIEGLALKEFGNYVDRDFMVGDTRPFPYSAEPYIALNLPFNGQIFSYNDEVIIDFLVIGGDMNLDGLSVQIKLNDYTYEIDELTPVRVSNLPIGQYTLSINLLKKDGTELEGPFSTITKGIVIQ